MVCRAIVFALRCWDGSFCSFAWSDWRDTRVTVLITSNTTLLRVQEDAGDRAKQAARAGEGGGDGGNADDDGKAADTLVLLDTMLVSSYMQCSPPRHSALVRWCHRCDDLEALLVSCSAARSAMKYTSGLTALKYLTVQHFVCMHK